MLRVPISELNLALTLPSGQAFRWRKRAVTKPQCKHDVWLGVINKHVIELSQDAENETIGYVFLNNSVSGEAAKRKRIKIDGEELLMDYFQLKSSLSQLYKTWCSNDTTFASVANKYIGVRVLRQPPVENLFSFICSSNNNIKRISSMVEKLCINFGDHLYDDEEFGPIHEFPEPSKLADHLVEAKLRELGFGYRAKFIQKSAAYIVSHENPNWLFELRNKSYEEVNSELTKLTGVGSKVADCVALFSLDQANAIPVDTHVYQIAARDYLQHLKGKKTVTKQMYTEIGAFFRERFGERAGWAHSVLFAADLKSIKV
ncbi:N-glycosylase/DNA lyase [Halotydeus destructor]|nr:N-glycosylase/DNA lyase [Halotydeus destructor]